MDGELNSRRALLVRVISGTDNIGVERTTDAGYFCSDLKVSYPSVKALCP